MKREAKTTEETLQQFSRRTIGQYLWGCHYKFVLDSNDETKHPESTRRWGYSRTSKWVPANQIWGAIFNDWQWRGGSRKDVYLCLYICFYQRQNTGSLMEQLESAQQFSFKYTLRMHSNVERFFYASLVISEQDWSNVYQILSWSF